MPFPGADYPRRSFHPCALKGRWCPVVDEFPTAPLGRVA